MSDDERQSVGMLRANVNVVNIDAIDRRYKLGQGVEPGFDLPPVVVGSPIAHELLQSCEWCALRLVLDRLLIGPSCGGDAPTEIDEIRFGNVDAEGANSIVGRGGQL